MLFRSLAKFTAEVMTGNVNHRIPFGKCKADVSMVSHLQMLLPRAHETPNVRFVFTLDNSHFNLKFINSRVQKCTTSLK